MWEYALLLVPLLFAWFAYDAMRVRETAIRLARAACERQGLQFLDFTVQGARLRVARNAEGQAALRRSYCFEFSDDGSSRRLGTIVMPGADLEALQFEPYRLE
ncbi:MAG: DUF3301 domain-containing protein [Betaproteobacteria bacterium]|nr:DUF3301 domain-containing protein [Betaproteobacteria bacterium]